MDGKRIIIFGGCSGTERIMFQPQDSLYVLDLITFKWYTPKISGKIPGSRYYHQANVIRNHMVITFGKYNIIYRFIIGCN